MYCSTCNPHVEVTIDNSSHGQQPQQVQFDVWLDMLYDHAEQLDRSLTSGSASTSAGTTNQPHKESTGEYQKG